MEIPALCSHCLKNEGLRREAAKFGPGTADACSRCGTRGGTKLDRPAVEELFRRFYCYGSQAAVYLPRVFTEGGKEDDDIQVEQSAQTDYNLLKEISGLTLRRHTPHLYELGFTEIRSEIEEILAQDPSSAPEEAAKVLKKNLHNLLEAGADYEMQERERLYRARISPACPLDPGDYDSPPSEKAVPNRIAVAGDRVLCGAFDIETCLVEIKPHIDDMIHHRIFVASLKPVGVLRLIDFTRRTQTAKSPALDTTLHAFFEANQSSYHLTQLLSRFARSRGYDGIVYPSAMECISGNKESWRNIAIFGAPIAGNRLVVESINRVLVRNVTHSFDLGPVWDDDTKGNQLAPYLKGWLKRARS
jgi:hypothetical protein